MSYYVWARIHPEAIDMPFLVDTGAGISLLPRNQYMAIPECDRPPLEHSGVKVFCGNSSTISIEGKVTLNLILQKVEYSCVFHVSADEVKGILGMNFIQSYGGKVDTGSQALILNNKEIDVYNLQGHRLNHKVVMAHTAAVPPGQRCVVNAKVVGKRDLDGQPVLVEGVRSLFASTGVLVAKALVQPDDGYIPVELFNASDTTQRICTNQTLGILRDVVDAELWEDTPSNRDKLRRRYPQAVPVQPVEPVHEETHADDVRVSVNKLYTGDPQHTGFFPAEDNCTWTCESVCDNYDEPPAMHRLSQFLPEHVRELYDKYVKELENPWDQVAFHKLLDEYHDVFAADKYDLGRATLAEHHIDTGDSAPFRQRPRRLPQEQHKEIERQVLKLAEVGIVRPSTSNYSSNVLLVKKKDETWRMCVDYRELNRQTRNKSPYMLPRIDDTLDALGGAKYFCTLDLLQGYHQVPLSPESIPKTAFTTPHMTPSLWEYVCMPFGITGGPATFQELMDRVLKGLEYKIALAYLDDVIVFGSTPSEVMNRLARVFNRMRAAHLKLKASKCTFFEEETNFLGHVVSSQGVKCDPKKIEAVANWKRPQTNRQALSFAAFVNYYNRFIPDFSTISKPLYELGRQRSFKWTDAHEEAFLKLQKAVISAPVMSYPREKGLWVLDTDACGYGMGATLSQMQPNDKGEEEERVIAFGSKALEGRQQRYCARRRELLAIVYFAKKFRPYLYGREVLIRTDHASLKYLKTMNNPGDQCARWIECLEEMYYTIEIRAGIKHINADALSRLPTKDGEIPGCKCAGKQCMCIGVYELEKHELEETGKLVDDWRMLSVHSKPGHPVLAAILVEFPQDDPVVTTSVNAFQFAQQWSSEDIAHEQRTDPDTKLLYEKKQAGAEKPSWKEIGALSEAAKVYFHDWRRISLREDGCLYRRWETSDGRISFGQLILPPTYRELIYHHMHESVTASHMGRRRTLNKIQKRFYWHRMGGDVQLWLQACLTCQKRSKGSRPARAPMTIAVPGEPNEKVAMDIIDHLNMSEDGNVCILVIIDHFTKYARAVALPNQKKATVAGAFWTVWLSYFGPPRQLHTDQGRNFESGLMKELCDMMGIHKTRTTPYHPAGDGQVERQNRTVMNMINTYAADDPSHWDRHLDSVLMGYNSTRHSVTGFEPNRMQIAFHVRTPIDLMMPGDPDVHVKPVNDWVRDREKHVRYMYALARANIQRAAVAQKRYYDQKAHYNHYRVGDAVWKRKFTFVKGQKYRDHFEGPFYVIKVLGDVTFRITRNPTAKEEVVAHDHLKPYVGEPVMDKSWIYERAQRDAYRFKRIKDVTAQTEETATAAEPSTQPAAATDEAVDPTEPAPANLVPVAAPATDGVAYQLRGRAVTRTAPGPRRRDPTPFAMPKRGKKPFFPRRRGRPRKIPPALVSALTITDSESLFVASATTNWAIALQQERYDILREKWRARLARKLNKTPPELPEESTLVVDLLWDDAGEQVFGGPARENDEVPPAITPVRWSRDSTPDPLWASAAPDGTPAADNPLSPSRQRSHSPKSYGKLKRAVQHVTTREKRKRHKKLPPLPKVFVEALEVASDTTASEKHTLTQMLIDLVEKRYQELRSEWRGLQARRRDIPEDQVESESYDTYMMLWWEASRQILNGKYRHFDRLEEGVPPIYVPEAWATMTPPVVYDSLEVDWSDQERMQHTNPPPKPARTRRARTARRFRHPHSVSPTAAGDDWMSSDKRLRYLRFQEYVSKWRARRARKWELSQDELSSDANEVLINCENHAYKDGERRTADDRWPPCETPRSWCSGFSDAERPVWERHKPSMRELMEREPRELRLLRLMWKSRSPRKFKHKASGPDGDVPGGREYGSGDELFEKRYEQYWHKWCEKRAARLGIPLSELSVDEPDIMNDLYERAWADVGDLKLHENLSPVETPLSWDESRCVSPPPSPMFCGRKCKHKHLPAMMGYELHRAIRKGKEQAEARHPLPPGFKRKRRRIGHKRGSYWPFSPLKSPLRLASRTTSESSS